MLPPQFVPPGAPAAQPRPVRRIRAVGLLAGMLLLLVSILVYVVFLDEEWASDALVLPVTRMARTPLAISVDGRVLSPGARLPWQVKDRADGEELGLGGRQTSSAFRHLGQRLSLICASLWDWIETDAGADGPQATATTEPAATPVPRTPPPVIDADAGAVGLRSLLWVAHWSLLPAVREYLFPGAVLLDTEQSQAGWQLMMDEVPPELRADLWDLSTNQLINWSTVDVQDALLTAQRVACGGARRPGGPAAVALEAVNVSALVGRRNSRSLLRVYQRAAPVLRALAGQPQLCRFSCVDGHNWLTDGPLFLFPNGSAAHSSEQYLSAHFAWQARLLYPAARPLQDTRAEHVRQTGRWDARLAESALVEAQLRHTLSQRYRPGSVGSAVTPNDFGHPRSNRIYDAHKHIPEGDRNVHHRLSVAFVSHLMMWTLTLGGDSLDPKNSLSATAGSAENAFRVTRLLPVSQFRHTQQVVLLTTVSRVKTPSLALGTVYRRYLAPLDALLAGSLAEGRSLEDQAGALGSATFSTPPSHPPAVNYHMFRLLYEESWPGAAEQMARFSSGGAQWECVAVRSGVGNYSLRCYAHGPHVFAHTEHMVRVVSHGMMSFVPGPGPLVVEIPLRGPLSALTLVSTPASPPCQEGDRPVQSVTVVFAYRHDPKVLFHTAVLSLVLRPEDQVDQQTHSHGWGAWRVAHPEAALAGRRGTLLPVLSWQMGPAGPFRSQSSLATRTVDVHGATAHVLAPRDGTFDPFACRSVDELQRRCSSVLVPPALPYNISLPVPGAGVALTVVEVHGSDRSFSYSTTRLVLSPGGWWERWSLHDDRNSNAVPLHMHTGQPLVPLPQQAFETANKAAVEREQGEDALAAELPASQRAVVSGHPVLKTGELYYFWRSTYAAEHFDRASRGYDPYDDSASQRQDLTVGAGRPFFISDSAGAGAGHAFLAFVPYLMSLDHSFSHDSLQILHLAEAPYRFERGAASPDGSLLAVLDSAGDVLVLNRPIRTFARLDARPARAPRNGTISSAFPTLRFLRRAPQVQEMREVDASAAAPPQSTALSQEQPAVAVTTPSEPDTAVQRQPDTESQGQPGTESQRQEAASQRQSDPGSQPSSEAEHAFEFMVDLLWERVLGPVRHLFAGMLDAESWRQLVARTFDPEDLRAIEAALVEDGLMRPGTLTGVVEEAAPAVRALSDRPQTLLRVLQVHAQHMDVRRGWSAEERAARRVSAVYGENWDAEQLFQLPEALDGDLAHAMATCHNSTVCGCLLQAVLDSSTPEDRCQMLRKLRRPDSPAAHTAEGNLTSHASANVSVESLSEPLAAAAPAFEAQRMPQEPSSVQSEEQGAVQDQQCPAVQVHPRSARILQPMDAHSAAYRSTPTRAWRALRSRLVPSRGTLPRQRWRWGLEYQIAVEARTGPVLDELTRGVVAHRDTAFRLTSDMWATYPALGGLRCAVGEGCLHADPGHSAGALMWESVEQDYRYPYAPSPHAEYVDSDVYMAPPPSPASDGPREQWVDMLAVNVVRCGEDTVRLGYAWDQHAAYNVRSGWETDVQPRPPSAANPSSASSFLSTYPLDRSALFEPFAPLSDRLPLHHLCGPRASHSVRQATVLLGLSSGGQVTAMPVELGGEASTFPATAVRGPRWSGHSSVSGSIAALCTPSRHPDAQIDTDALFCLAEGWLQSNQSQESVLDDRWAFQRGVAYRAAVRRQVQQSVVTARGSGYGFTSPELGIWGMIGVLYVLMMLRSRC